MLIATVPAAYYVYKIAQKHAILLVKVTVKVLQANYSGINNCL
jgi:hypothetical protein